MTRGTDDFLKPPRLSPIGIVEYDDHYQGTPRRYPWVLQLFATLILIVFALVTIVTTSASLGAWCLTSSSAPPPQGAVRLLH
ncbi:MAG: hypothetical protein AAFS10_13225 [Myxococcota bacterium]